MHRIEEIEQRLAAIASELETASGDALTALENEVTALTEERTQLQNEVQARQALRAKVAAGSGVVMERGSSAVAAPEQFTAASPEYRSAFVKSLRGETLTAVEQRAYTFLTTATAAPIPVEMQNQIVDLISAEHPIVGDVLTVNSGCEIVITVAKTLVTGAAKTTEGGAASEMEITFEDKNLSGDDYTANVKVSYKMLAMAVSAFETYINGQIAVQLGAVLATDIVTNIKAQMNSANKFATGVTYANICSGFGALKRVGTVIVYGTRAGVFNKLVAMVDSNKRPIFQQPITAAAAGTLLGCTVKYEDALGDTELLIGDPKKYTQNVAAPMVIESAKDLDNHKVTISGYTCQQGALVDDKAFALVADA